MSTNKIENLTFLAFNNLPVAVICADKSGIIFFVNRKTTDLLGYKAEEMISKPITDFATPGKGYNGMESLMESFNKDEAFIGKFTFITKDKLEIPILVSISPIFDETRKIIGVTGMAEVIADKQLIENIELEKANILLKNNQKEKQLIMDSMTDWIAFQDLNHNYTWSNKATKKYTGCTDDELRQKKCYQIWFGANKECQGCPVRVAIDSGIVCETQHTDKQNRTWLIKSFPVYDDNNKIIGAVETGRDITERILRENQNRELIEKLQKNENEFRHLVSQMNQGLAVHELVFDKKGEPIDYKYVLINEIFEKYTGLKKEIVLNKTTKELKLPIEDKWYEIFFNVAITGKPYFTENYAKNIDKYYELTAYQPLPNQFAVILNDITDRKIAEIELLKKQKEIELQNQEYKKINEELFFAKEKAEESERLKSAFLSNISHEIRTPMNSIIGFSELFAQDNISIENRRRYSEIVINSSNKLLQIISDIVDISKIETKQISLKNEEFIVSDLIKGLTNSFQDLAIAKSLDFRLNCKIKNLKIVSDEAKIRQIINHLLHNAFKFTSKGFVELKCELTENIIVFKVTDTGVGIKPEHIEKIFKHFVQSDQKIAADFGGAGLGLSIATAFSELLGGSISVESEFGKGTSFTVKIPVIKVESYNKSKINSAMSENKSKTMQVLIAEDEDINYFYLETILEKTGISLLRANNGKEAVDIVKRNPNIKLIIMDIKMPVMSGIEATKIIKTHNPEIKIIAYTAYAMMGDNEKLIDEGCDDYISKPAKQTELINLISKYFKVSF
ncbi:MAG: response regulator [Bacteroidales bacterium]|nr:response regulator [Bacteroidales bacterium]